MVTSVIAQFRPFKHTSSADPSFAVLQPEAAHQRGARQVCPTWTENGTRGWMDRRRDRQAGRQTDGHTNIHRDYPLCNPQLEGQSAKPGETDMFWIFTPVSLRRENGPCVWTCVFFFFLSAIKCDQQPHGVHQLSFIWESAYVRSTRLCVCVYACVIAWQMGRSYKRTAQIRILHSRVRVRALASKPNCSSVTVSYWAVAG